MPETGCGCLAVLSSMDRFHGTAQSTLARKSTHQEISSGNGQRLYSSLGEV